MTVEQAIKKYKLQPVSVSVSKVKANERGRSFVYECTEKQICLHCQRWRPGNHALLG